MKLFKFTVSGQGRFPFDMLRYDQCWPSNEDAIFRINEKEYRSIVMLGTRLPTSRRWLSFGWDVHNNKF